jgi:cytochrome b561
MTACEEMMESNTANWGVAARVFHWGLGLTIIGMIAFGYWMNHWAPRPDRLFYRSIHADIGYLVLLFTALRLIWRAISPRPALPADMPRWERVAAYFNHGALYLFTFIVAFLGWAHSGAHRPDYSGFFGLFHVPQFTSENRELANTLEDRHILMAYVLLALIMIHVAAALYHHFGRRDSVLTGMIGRG